MSAFDPKITQGSLVIKTWSLTIRSASYPCDAVKKLWWNMFLWNGDSAFSVRALVKLNAATRFLQHKNIDLGHFYYL